MRLTLAVAYVLLLALVAFGIPLAASLRDRVDTEVRSQARSQAQVVAASAEEVVDARGSAGTLRRLVSIAARSVRGRVIVVSSRGRVIADSSDTGEAGAYYGDRPEIASALQGRPYQAQRHSSTLGEDILATAVPVYHRRTPVGAVRITQSVQAISSAVDRSTRDLILLGGVVMLLGLLAGGLLANQIARPIRRLDRAARRVAAGDLSVRAKVEGSSEQRSLAHAFNEMTARLARLLRSQQEFVADASHQLRTPLTGIRLRLEELRDTAGDGGPDAKQLDAGLAEVDRLSQIVEELLVLSQAGEHELPAETLSLGDAAARAVERWRGVAAEEGIELRLDPNPGAGSAQCAPADLDRALDSLVGNAIRYSPPGTEVIVRAIRGGIEVLDRGPGIDPGEGEAVFERFYRGRAGRAGPPGSGLGLPIARELIRQWGGEVTLAARAGGGTRALLTVPSAAPSGTVSG